MLSYLVSRFPVGLAEMASRKVKLPPRKFQITLVQIVADLLLLNEAARVRILDCVKSQNAGSEFKI